MSHILVFFSVYAGIKIDIFLILQYNQCHYGTGVKRLSTINYCAVKTNKLFNLYNRRLDGNESKKDFTLEYVSLDKLEGKLLDSASTPEQEDLTKEIIAIINCFKTKPRALKKEFRGG